MAEIDKMRLISPEFLIYEIRVVHNFVIMCFSYKCF